LIARESKREITSSRDTIEIRANWRRDASIILLRRGAACELIRTNRSAIIVLSFVRLFLSFFSFPLFPFFPDFRPYCSRQRYSLALRAIHLNRVFPLSLSLSLSLLFLFFLSRAKTVLRFYFPTQRSFLARYARV